MKHLLLSALLITGCSQAGEERKTYCDYVLPDEYCIAQNTYSGKYIIRGKSVGDLGYRYFAEINKKGIIFHSGGSFTDMPFIAEYKDTCELKYSFYEYIKQQNKASQYKPLTGIVNK